MKQLQKMFYIFIKKNKLTSSTWAKMHKQMQKRRKKT